MKNFAIGFLLTVGILIAIAGICLLISIYPKTSMAIVLFGCCVNGGYCYYRMKLEQSK